MAFIRERVISDCWSGAPAQVEVAVGEALLLGRLDLVLDRERGGLARG